MNARVLKWSFLLVLVMFSRPAFSDVTVCEGDDCTVVSGGNVRKMTPEEVRQKRRTEINDSIQRIDCALADVPTACQHAVQNLLENFR